MKRLVLATALATMVMTSCSKDVESILTDDKTGKDTELQTTKQIKMVIDHSEKSRAIVTTEQHPIVFASITVTSESTGFTETHCWQNSQSDTLMFTGNGAGSYTVSIQETDSSGQVFQSTSSFSITSGYATTIHLTLGADLVVTTSQSDLTSYNNTNLIETAWKTWLFYTDGTYGTGSKSTGGFLESVLISDLTSGIPTPTREVPFAGVQPFASYKLAGANAVSITYVADQQVTFGLGSDTTYYGNYLPATVDSTLHAPSDEPDSAWNTVVLPFANMINYGDNGKIFDMSANWIPYFSNENSGTKMRIMIKDIHFLTI